MEIGNRRKKRSSKLSVTCRDLGVAVLDWIAFWIRLPICLLPLTFYTNLNKGAHELITHFCSLSQQLLRKFYLVMRRVFLQKFQVCIIFHLHVVRKWIEAGLKLSPLEDRNQGLCCCSWRRKKRKEMGGLLLPHHQTFPNSLQAAIPGSLSLHKGVHLFCSPRQGFPRSFWSALIRSEANGNGVASPDMVSKHSKEELIAFFRDIQTSIAESSPKASKRTRKQPPDPLKEVHRREQSHGRGDGGAGDVSEERQRKVMNLEDMNVADLRELARARRMRGYSKLKKGELIDRLKGVMQ